ncbi:MAG: HNH endonuclease, partial [Actinomycetes bacterium]
MFERLPTVAEAPASADAAGGVLTTASLTALLGALDRPDRTAGDDQRIDQIRLLEQVKAAAAAAQAVLTADFAGSQRAQQRAAGVPARDLGRGIAAQVALARSDSPARGSRHLGLAQALVHEMPATLAALRAGQTSEWRATLMVRETACLSVED